MKNENKEINEIRKRAFTMRKFLKLIIGKARIITTLEELKLLKQIVGLMIKEKTIRDEMILNFQEQLNG